MKLFHWTLRTNPKVSGTFAEEDYRVIKEKGWEGKYEIREEVVPTMKASFAPPTEVTKLVKKQDNA